VEIIVSQNQCGIVNREDIAGCFGESDVLARQVVGEKDRVTVPLNAAVGINPTQRDGVGIVERG